MMLVSDYSLRQVITTGKLANVNSYETLMEASFGRPGFIFLSLNMLFLSYGAMIAYLTIIKDVLPILFGITPHDEDMKRMIMLGSSLVVILPLSMQRDMADLEKTSRLNVLLNLILVGIVTGYSPVVESVRGNGGLWGLLGREKLFHMNSFFVGFGVASFAFVCQDSSFIIAGSLSNPTKSRWKIVTRAAMFTCCTLELTIGICGYLAYQQNTVGNVLNNMEIHHWSGLVSRAILATTMFFAYPMNLYIARHACVVLFFEGISAHEGSYLDPLFGLH
jgi:sodium-coupled neutral amino acid transporter 11